jgi:hypothetical protein
MRRRMGLALLAASFLLGGCATSLRPVAPEKACVFDPTVVGTWTATDEDGKTTPISVEKKDTDGYLISGTSPETNYRVAYSVKLFRLGATLFYDAAVHHVSVKGEDVDIEDLDVYARHAFGKIRILPDEIRNRGAGCGMDQEGTRGEESESEIRKNQLGLMG